MNDGQRRPRRRRSPEEVAAAIERQRQLTEYWARMDALHFPALVKKSEVTK